MALHTSGEISVDVPRSAAFAFLQDPHRLAACVPGCHDVREVGPNRYAAVLSSRVAFMTLSFDVTIEILRMDAPDAIDARITGDAVGLVGHVSATASVRLAEADARRTTIRYTTDIALTGKLGGLGQPVFRSTSAQLAREFGANVKKAIESEPARPASISLARSARRGPGAPA
jgi:carbon monoxide dehydrogenase subunit G